LHAFTLGDNEPHGACGEGQGHPDSGREARLMEPKKMIMKKLLAVSVFVLTDFASVAGPAVADEIGSERSAPGWYGPREVS